MYMIIPLLLLMVASLSSAFMAAYTDPGILPRGINPKSEIALNGSTDYGGQPISLLVYHPNCPEILMGKEITNESGQKLFIKYCNTCEIFRPPRSSHCSYCDNCVEEFDHHCPWVSNCVGRRNYRYFLLFLMQVSALIDLSFILIVILLHRSNTNGAWNAMADNVAATAVSFLCCVCGLCTHGLLFYNLNLIALDQTTSEHLKGYEGGSNRSFFRNMGRVFCSKRPARNVAWKEFRGKPTPGICI